MANSIIMFQITYSFIIFTLDGFTETTIETFIKMYE